ncbi:MAG: DUF3347 domain-containing protein [Opitutaceae bacterium]
MALSLIGLARLGAADSMQMPMKSDMPMKSEILAAYVKISAALAADDLKAAQAAAAEVADHAGMAKKNADLAAKAQAVADAADLAKARESFKALSTAIEPLATGEKDYVVMHCPMMKADWVQTGTAVKNPYYGKSMLTCGAPKKSS